MVVNFDLPVKHVADRHMPTTPDYETYLHRIGRSGRFVLKGEDPIVFL
jgi:ATP-dependent RNA helicase DDX19/DBP5